MNRMGSVFFYRTGSFTKYCVCLWRYYSGGCCCYWCLKWTRCISFIFIFLFLRFSLPRFSFSLRDSVVSCILFIYVKRWNIYICVRDKKYRKNVSFFYLFFIAFLFLSLLMPSILHILPVSFCSSFIGYSVISFSVTLSARIKCDSNKIGSKN